MSLPLAEATEPVWRGALLHGAGERLGQLLCLLAFPFAFAFSPQLLGEMLATQAQSPQKSTSSAETTQQSGWVQGSTSPAGFGYQSSSCLVLILLIQCQEQWDLNPCFGS